MFIKLLKYFNFTILAIIITIIITNIIIVTSTTNNILHSTNLKSKIDVNWINNSDFDIVHLHWINNEIC